MKARLMSFVYAFQGLKTFFIEEAHAKIHSVLALAAIALAWAFGISRIDWLLIVLCIFSVFSAEIFNTAIERLSDKVEKNQDPLIKKTKDLSSAAVLVVSLMSLVVGGIIFIPEILNHFF